MAAKQRKKYLKKVELNGESVVATMYEGDKQWVVSHDHQESLKAELNEQESSDV